MLEQDLSRTRARIPQNCPEHFFFYVSKGPPGGSVFFEGYPIFLGFKRNEEARRSGGSPTPTPTPPRSGFETPKAPRWPEAAYGKRPTGSEWFLEKADPESP